MNAKHTPGPLFVRQPEMFPFDVEIVEASGNVVFQESRCALSTKQKTVEDVMQGHGFPVDQRDAVIAANERQVADMTLLAAAPDLLEALNAVEGAYQCGADLNIVMDQVKSAIAKATG